MIDSAQFVQGLGCKRARHSHEKRNTACKKLARIENTVEAYSSNALTISRLSLICLNRGTNLYLVLFLTMLDGAATATALCGGCKLCSAGSSDSDGAF